MQSLNLQKCADELLDLGKRNRLLYFSESSGILKAISSLSNEELFRELMDGKQFPPFDLDGLQNTLGLTNENLNNNTERQWFYSKAKESYLSSSDHEKKILFLPRKSTLKTAMKRIASSAQESLEERGINTLYFAFGMLTWKDTIDPKETIDSPLLLVPVSLVRDRVNNNYRLVYNDGDDVQVNSTLAYKLRQTYHLTLPAFDPEKDTYQSFMEAMKGTIALYQDWTLKDTSYVGLFAFSKIDMYHDIKDHEDKVMKNPVIQKLFSLPCTETAAEESLSIDTSVLHNVVDADSSQRKAIKASKKGESFVLEGPPGTGKSQTITNIIAEALYDGKRVLFVSEKKAALDVVLRKLTEAGLSDFCLPLHGNKANKKEVLLEINRVLHSDKSKVTEEALRALHGLDLEKKELSNYLRLSGNMVASLSMPVYQVIGHAIHYQKYEAPLFRFEEIQKKDKAYLDAATGNLTEISSLTKEFGRILEDYPFYGVKEDCSDYEKKIDFQIAVDNCLASIGEIKDKTEKILLYSHCGNTVKAIKAAIESLSFFRSIPFYDAVLFHREQRENLRNLIKDSEEKLLLRDTEKEEVLSLSEEDFLALDAKQYLEDFAMKYSSFLRVFKPSYHKTMKYLALKSGKAKLNREEAISLLKKLKSYQKKENDAKEALASLDNLMEEKGRINEESLSSLHYSFDHSERGIEDYYYEHPLSFSEYQKLRKEIESLSMADFSSVEKLSLYFEEDKVSLEEETLEELGCRLHRMKEEFVHFGENMRLFRDIRIAKEETYYEFVSSYLKSELLLDDFINTFKKCFYTQWAQFLLSCSPQMNGFQRPTNDSLVNDFIRDDRLSFKISQSQIREACFDRIPDSYAIPGSLLSSFAQEANKKRNLPSIRVLMNKYGPLVQKIKPCFMMSPLTVSTFLGENMDFDLIVFDEASQVFPWDAIGAIYRGKQSIIVGDNRQMPPTSFFMAGMSENEEEESEGNDIASYESILDFAATFAHYRLQWHYRSKSEDLIAFSNENFYHGSLVTFPSAKRKKEGFGVDFYYVDAAVYNRKTRVNEAEVERVIDLICEDVRKYPEDSLGVVVMNIAQQEKVMDALEKRSREDEVLKAYLDKETKNPLFIKNLETVQGDERDRIILSVGYGRDEEGKLYHNFGPLNRQGGERRLNVAITRAKVNVQVVSSLHCYDIKEERITSVGPKLLRSYLEFAERGESLAVIDEEEREGEERYLEDEVEAFLEEQGYQVKRNLGCSKDRIDLAVSHPSLPEYVLAIECDTESYHKKKEARDRERLRREVLEGQGWHYYRIWSTDFFLHPEMEKKRLIETLENAVHGVDGAPSVSPSLRFEDSETRVPMTLDSLFARYPYSLPDQADYQISLNDGSYVYQLIDENIEDYVRREEPIVLGRLIHEMALLSGRKAVSSAFISCFNQVLKNRRHPLIQVVNEPYSSYCYLDDGKKDFALRLGGDRCFDEVPGPEIEDGLFRIVSCSVSISYDDLLRAYVSLFGYHKVSSDTSTKIGWYVRKLLEEDKLSMDQNNVIRVKK